MFHINVFLSRKNIFKFNFTSKYVPIILIIKTTITDNLFLSIIFFTYLLSLKIAIVNKNILKIKGNVIKRPDNPIL